MAENTKLSEQVEEILKGARSDEGARNALALLFPKIEKSIKTYVPNDRSTSSERKRNLRISERDFAPAYFGLDPRKISWGRNELQELLSGGPSKFFETVKARIESSLENDRPRLRRLALEALDEVFDERLPFTAEWLNAIVEVSPYYIAAKDEFAPVLFAISNLDRLRIVVRHALASLNESSRAYLMKQASSQAKDLTLLCDIVRTLAGDKNPEGATGPERDGFGEETDNVREQLLGRVREMAASGEIWSQAQPEIVIWFWWGSNFASEVQAFSARAIETEEGLRGFLAVTPNQVRSTAGNYERVSPTWSKIVNLDLLSKKAEGLLEADLPTDIAIAQRFLKALQRGQESSFRD